jgi:hypothetical protein
MTKKKDRAAELFQVSEALVEAFREELLGSNETRIAALEQRMAQIEQWPEQFRLALLSRLLDRVH